MKTKGIVVVGAILASVAFRGLLASSDQNLPDPVEVKIVKYGDLANFVAANKGNVVLLDFWSTTCVPCKRSFPHTVEMHNKYRAKGLVVVSVSTFELEAGMDQNQREDVKKSVLKFLRSKDAFFTNVILDEPSKLVDEKLRISKIPCLYVFNREGKWTQFSGDQLNPDAEHRHLDVENYVRYCLEKPAAKNYND